MTEEKYLKARALQLKIGKMQSALNLIDHTHEQKFPPEFTIQGMTNHERIENAELNKKLELMVVEFVQKEISLLQKQFDEL